MHRTVGGPLRHAGCEVAASSQCASPKRIAFSDSPRRPTGAVHRTCGFDRHHRRHDHVIEPVPAVSDLPATSLTAPDPATETERRDQVERHPWWRRPGSPRVVRAAAGRDLRHGRPALQLEPGARRHGQHLLCRGREERDRELEGFFFGSLDPGSFITVDKPPAALWVMELSGRIFGFSSLSMLLPEALAGVAP